MDVPAAFSRSPRNRQARASFSLVKMSADPVNDRCTISAETPDSTAQFAQVLGLFGRQIAQVAFSWALTTTYRSLDALTIPTWPPPDSLFMLASSESFHSRQEGGLVGQQEKVARDFFFFPEGQ